MSDDKPPRKSEFKEFQVYENESVFLPDEDADIGDAVATFNGLHEARRAANRPGNEDFVEAITQAFREDREGLERVLAILALDEIMDLYAERMERAQEKGDRDVFEESAVFHEKEGGSFIADEEKIGEKVENWTESPPAFCTEAAANFLEEIDDWEKWGEWTATHVMYWAARDVNKSYWEEGTNPEDVPEEEWDRRFNDQLTVQRYFSDAAEILGSRIAEMVAGGFRQAVEKEAPSLLQIEKLLGLHEDEADAPTPRPDKTAASSAERDGFFPWATGAPSSIGITAIRQGMNGGWPETDNAGRPKYPISQKRPHHVEGQFSIIIPDNNQAGAAVEAEMAQQVLDEFDRHTTRLHLACAAYSVKGDPGKYTPIPRQYVYDMLGMKWDQRSDLSRDEKDLKVERAFRNLQKLGVQMSVMDGPDGAPDSLGLESVWNLNTHNWGQKRINDTDRILDTEHWELLVRPNAWHQLYLSEETGARQFGFFSRKLLENIDWHNNPAAGDLAIELLKYVKFQDGGAPRDLTVETMLGICGLGQAQQSYEQTRNRQKLQRAILEQERWGWDVEWTRWPDAYRPDKGDHPGFPAGWWTKGAQREDWESSFKDWKVTFYPPENLAEMNSRAEKIDNSEPHELEAKGWDERIKAILDETEYIQADLARILDVSAGAVTRWKNGDRTPGGAHRAKLKDIERRNGLRQG